MVTISPQRVTQLLRGAGDLGRGPESNLCLWLQGWLFSAFDVVCPAPSQTSMTITSQPWPHPGNLDPHCGAAFHPGRAQWAATWCFCLVLGCSWRSGKERCS